MISLDYVLCYSRIPRIWGGGQSKAVWAIPIWLYTDHFSKRGLPYLPWIVDNFVQIWNLGIYISYLWKFGKYILYFPKFEEKNMTHIFQSRRQNMTLGLGRGVLGGKFRTLTPLPTLTDFFLKKVYFWQSSSKTKTQQRMNGIKDEKWKARADI